MKKVKILGKSVSVLAVMGLFLMSLVSAALVVYLSNTISEQVTVESPITLEWVDGDIDIDNGGEDGFALVKLVNNADVEITGDVVIEVLLDGEEIIDMEGIHIAVTEDINYYFDPEWGSCDGPNNNGCGPDTEGQDWLGWLAAHPDWNDWVADSEYSDILYPSPLVVNTDGDSFVGIGYTGNKLILPDAEIPPESTVYGVMYVATDPALEPGEYTFEVTIVP